MSDAYHTRVGGSWIEGAQVSLNRRCAARVRDAADPRFHSSRLATIDRRVRQKLGDDFRVSYRAVPEVEKTARGKHKWLVSRLQHSTSSAERPITD